MRVFLSFNSKDLALAQAVRTGLARLEPDAEFFYSPDSLGAGFWLPKLAEEIGAADAFLLLVGPGGLGPWQEVEYYTAFDRHVEDKRFTLVPAILAGAEAPGLPFLRSLNWVVAPLATEDRTLHRLVAALKGENVAQATPLWKLINPYRGLEAMTEANADYFFGRDVETTAVLASLAEQPGRCPILIGASGVGKSSVAQAGVLSALKAMRLPGRDESRASAWPKALENSRGFAFVTLRPGDAPLEALAAALTRPWIDLTDPDQVALRRKLAAGLGHGDYTLPDLIETMQARLLKQQGVAPDRVLIYLDQGEELYTRAPPQEAQRFSALLAEALPDKRLLVFASLRADYFDWLQADQPLFAVHAHVNVPPLAPARLREVVRAPAQALGVSFEDGELADRIAQAAAAQAGALPLLSYLLTDMWAGMVQRDDGTLRLPGHAIDIGGVLARRAEGFLQQHPAEEAALRRLLTLRLATVPPQGEPVRRQTAGAECSETEWSLAARLAEYPWRLVVMRARDDSAEIVAEVAHEALLRAWPRLAAWLREERDFLVFKGEAERAEQRWAEMGRPDRALLSGLDLGRADEWLRARADDLPTGVREFAQRSIATDRATKEKQLRVQRRLSLIAGIAALVMAVISAVAWVQWDRARKAQETARNAAAAAVENAAVALENEGRALAALSRVAASKGSFADSVHLALAAWPRTPADRRPRLPTVLDSLSLGLSIVVPVRAEFRHDAWVSGALLTRDEARLLSWSGDKTLRLWEVATGRQIGPAMMHDGEVYGALLARDETRILSWSRDKSVRLWDVATGRQIGPAMMHDGEVYGALLMHDETGILSWSHDKTVRLWDVATGRQIGPAMMHDEWIVGALLTRDETRILSWSEDNTVRLWDVATGRQIGPAMTHDSSVLGALLTRDDTRILSWSVGGTVRLWDVATGRQIGPAMAHDDRVRHALLTRDETRILSWSADKTARLWDVATGGQIGLAMTHDGAVSGALLIRDETRVLSWSGDNTVRLWDIVTGRQAGPPMMHDGRVTGALFGRDETRILSWSEDRTVRLWDVATGRQIGPAMTHDGPVSGARLTRDEARILSWSADRTLRLWDVATGRQIGPAMTHDGVVLGALLTRDETRILSGSVDGTVRLWDVATGRQLGPAMRHDSQISGARFTRDETRILSWSYDGTVRLWDVATGRQLGPAMSHNAVVVGALLTRDETRVLSWSGDSTVRLWDVATGAQIGPAMTHQGRVFGARLTRDETRILSWSGDRTLRLWDVGTGRQLGPPMTQDNTLVFDALFTHDETRILSLSYQTMQLWDVATGRQLGPAMQRFDRFFFSPAVLSRDETRILSWSRQTMRLWDVSWRGRSLPEIACNHSPPDHDLASLSARYGIKIDDPICEPEKAVVKP